MSARLLSGATLTRILSVAALLAATPAFPQLIDRPAEPPKSIVSLAPSPKPEGELLARRTGDAMFANEPANYHVFAAGTVGRDGGVEMLTVRFAAATQVTRIESRNNDFAIEGGSCHEGASYAKGDSCTLLVRFNPQGPGHRLGFISIANTAEPTPAQVGLLGNGYGPAISFIPSATNTIAATFASPNGVLKSATNITVDGGDVLYIGDTGNTAIRMINSTGNMTTITPGLVGETVASVAVDTAGAIYYTGTSGSEFYFSVDEPWSGTGTGYFTTYAPGTCTPSSPCALTSVGMSDPANASMDADDNLFLEEKTRGAAEMNVSGVSGGNGSLSLWYLTDGYAYSPGPGPGSFAVDQSDNLYTAYANINCMIVEESTYEAEYEPTANRVAGSIGCGFAGDGGAARNAAISATLGQIAFDAAGDLYFVDSGNQRVRRVDYTTGVIRTVAGTGANGFTNAAGNRSTALPLSNPTGLTVDSQGQIYVVTDAPANSATQVVQKVGTLGYLLFPSTSQGATSAVQIVTVTNTGNSTMILDSYAFTGNNPGDFSIDPTNTNCPLTAGAELQTGATCQIGVLFKPTATGNRTAYLKLLDNTVTGSNSVQLTGAATAPSPAFAPGAVSFPNTTPTLSNTIPITVTNKGNVALAVQDIKLGGANADAFSFTGNCAGGSIEPGASCNLTVTFKPSSSGNYSATLSFTDNAPDSPQVVPISGAGAKPYTSATKLASAANPAPACSAVTFHVAVSTSDGSMATGPVSLQMGSLTLASGTLTNGAATLTVQGLAPGLNHLTANYGGDSEHEGSLSTTLSQMVNRGSCGSFGPPAPAREAPVHELPVTDRP